jgi:hypothetical protein
MPAEMSAALIKASPEMKLDTTEVPRPVSEIIEFRKCFVQGIIKQSEFFEGKSERRGRHALAGGKKGSSVC